MEEIALIEELAANAVVPVVSQELDGWRLRFNYGVTRRAGSVLAAREGLLDLDERLALAEQFYARRGEPARFQLCPASRPSGLEERLIARGYALDGPPTHVQVADLAVMRGVEPGPARVSERFGEEWLRAYCESEGVSDPVKVAARRSMLERVGPLAGYATAVVDGEVAAVALGVVERGWLGLFSVATRPEQRRRGLGLATLASLAAWAAEHGAARCYLQVFSANTPALNLYRRLGFRTLYDYWYRVRRVTGDE